MRQSGMIRAAFILSAALALMAMSVATGALPAHVRESPLAFRADAQCFGSAASSICRTAGRDHQRLGDLSHLLHFSTVVDDSVGRQGV